MKIYLAGIPAGTTEEELCQLLNRYIRVTELQLVDIDHPHGAGALLTVEGTNAEAHWAARRLTGMYWKGHSLQAYVQLFSDR